jgi:hypothetical protein
MCHTLQTETRYSVVGLFQWNPECQVPLSHQCNHWAESQRRGMFPSGADDPAVVERLSMRWFQGFQGREKWVILWLNLCYSWIHHDKQVQHVKALCEKSECSGLQLEGVQECVVWYILVASWQRWTSFGMIILGNGKRSTVALLIRGAVWSIHCKQGQQLVPVPSSLVWVEAYGSREIYWASIPSPGDSLHASICKTTACAMSHNTMKKTK